MSARLAPPGSQFVRCVCGVAVCVCLSIARCPHPSRASCSCYKVHQLRSAQRGLRVTHAPPRCAPEQGYCPDKCRAAIAATGLAGDPRCRELVKAYVDDLDGNL